MMFIEGIVTARSRKQGGFCLVVFNIKAKKFLRIVSDALGRVDGELIVEECTSESGNMIQLLDVVKVPIKTQMPIKDEYQKENLVFDEQGTIQFIRKSNKNELIELFGVKNLNSKPSIFLNPFPSMYPDEAKMCGNSFMFARVFKLEFYEKTNSKGEPSCKCRFKYNQIEYSDVSVTISETKEEDIYKYARKGKKYPIAFVCFSFGHPYNGKCHKYLCSFLGCAYSY